MNTGCTVCNTGTIVTVERDGLRLKQCNYCGDVVSMENSSPRSDEATKEDAKEAAHA